MLGGSNDEKEMAASLDDDHSHSNDDGSKCLWR